MPSLDAIAQRHLEIDRRLGQYLCFPDIAHSGDGALLCVYNEYDKHVGSRRRLLLKRSEDGGRTWSQPQLLCAKRSHCPRISLLSDGMLLIADSAISGLYLSTDSGRNWIDLQQAGLTRHDIFDRVLELDHETLFTTGHTHRGAQPQPKINQAPSEQMAYISRNRGNSWNMHSVVASEKCLVLCEASVIRLPDIAPEKPPRLLALMRENSFVGEPMYACISEDGGNTWGRPLPTPLVGHRPCLGWTASGKLVVTYRCVGPDPGTKAWLGSVDELCSGFAVHGLHPAPEALIFTPEGLLLRGDKGPDKALRFSLRPITDPESATASLEAEVLVHEAEDLACGLYLGQWWTLVPDAIVPAPLPLYGEQVPASLEKIPFTPGEPHVIRVDYTPGVCKLYIDGECRGEFPMERMHIASRPVQFGTVDRQAGGPFELVLKRLALQIQEPLPGRNYAWSWHHAQGAAPDAWIDARVLELQNDRRAASCDFGYSGWVELPEPGAGQGEFFCVYHHGDGENEDYRPGYSSHVAGTRFYEADFGG